MFKPFNAIEGTQFYAGFETLSNEQAAEQLLDSWSTPEQRYYNYTHTTCPTCNGKGYETHKAGSGQRFRFERDNCGCPQCLGTGAIEK